MSGGQHKPPAYKDEVATDAEVSAFDEFQQAPWTAEQYEKVRQAAIALVRTHVPRDLANSKKIVATFDGAKLYALLSALDRSEDLEVFMIRYALRRGIRLSDDTAT